MMISASTDPSLFPSEPVAYIFVLILMMLYGRYLTQEGGEILMVFFNIVLSFLGLAFRFPKQMKTFTSRMKYQEKFYQGIKEFVSCSRCHAIYPLPLTKQERMAKKYCIFATRISSTTRHVLHRCGNELYYTTKAGKLNPLRMYVYNSIINTLKQFASRQGFWKI